MDFRSFMSNSPLSEILKLSVAERIQLVGDVWDSIAAESGSVPLASEEVAELDRRLDEAEESPGTGKSWTEGKERLLSRA